MIAIDTNILVRLLISDNPAQNKAVQKLFVTEEIFVAVTVLLETEWVLRAAFDLSPTDVCTAFRRICGLRNVTVANDRRLAQAIDWHEAGFDFADACHLALSTDQEAFKTFDADFIRNAKRHSDRRVERP